VKETKDNFQKLILPNGLTVLLYKMDSVLSVYIACYIKSGPLWEESDERGVAHFCEHLAFDGTKNLSTSLAVSEYAQGIGAFTNASTNLTSTKFWIKSAYNNFGASLQLLHDLIFEPRLNDKDIEKEKLVITSEYNDWWQNPDNSFNYNSLQKRFKGSGQLYSRRSLGTPETISKLSKDVIIIWQNRYYRPNNMILSIVGNFEFNKVKHNLEKTFNLESKGKIPVEPKINLNDYSDINIYLEEEKRSQIRFFVNYPAFGWRDVTRKEEMELGLLSHLLGSGQSSRLFTRLREVEHVTYSISSNMTLYPHLGFFEIYGTVPADKVECSLKIIREEIENICKNEVTDKEMALSRKVFASGCLMKFESPESIANYLVSEEADFGEIHLPQYYVDISERLEAKDIQNLALRILSDKRINISLFGDVKNIKTEKLKGIFN
jgi:predicted Zn-dependent peptidase